MGDLELGVGSRLGGQASRALPPPREAAYRHDCEEGLAAVFFPVSHDQRVSVTKVLPHAALREFGLRRPRQAVATRLLDRGGVPQSAAAPRGRAMLSDEVGQRARGRSSL